MFSLPCPRLPSSLSCVPSSKSSSSWLVMSLRNSSSDSIVDTTGEPGSVSGVAGVSNIGALLRVLAVLASKLSFAFLFRV